MDPQGNLSGIIGNLNPGEQPRHTIFDVLDPDTKLPMEEAYLDTRQEYVKLCYGSLKMATLEKLFTRHMDPSRVLTKALNAEISRLFDYIVIDCPPSLTTITVNSLCAVEHFIVPIPTGDSLALDGVEQLDAVVSEVRELNERLNLLGVVFTRHKAQLKIAKLVVEETEEIFGKENIFQSRIRENTLIQQAVHSRETIFEYNNNAPGALDYRAFAKEVIERLPMDLLETECEFDHRRKAEI
jgi:chromosome partitioning protein